MKIILSPNSPNFGERGEFTPEMVVVHSTDGIWPQDMEWLCSQVSQVSSHFIISPSGEVHQLVSSYNTAWHAGRVNLPVAKLKKDPLGIFINPNKYTIGIEVSLKPPAVMPQGQKTALIELIQLVCSHHKIPMDRDHIVGHKEIYSLKTCPGTINVDEIVNLLGGPVNPPLPNNTSIKVQIMDLLNKIV